VGAALTALLALAVSLPLKAGEPFAQGLSGRLIVGYQGWFGCPGDFEGSQAWEHWSIRGLQQPDGLTVDLLPATAGMKEQDLCDTGLPRADGRGTIRLFSSQTPAVVLSHFRMMQEHDIDGAAVQRFVVELLDPARKRRRDHVLALAQAAAVSTQRVFYIVYDISGSPAATVANDIRTDWQYLVNVQQVTASPAYLRDHGKPVLELWGFGFGDRPGTPAEVAALIADLKAGRNGLAAATVIGGVPSRWRTLQRDSKSDPAWAGVYRSYDVISPWMVGRFPDGISADRYLHSVVNPDLAAARRAGVRYMPVMFPGFSWSNLMRNREEPDRALLNVMPRMCGRFLWRQARNLLSVHVESLYVAMFDEADEATAIFPVASTAGELPRGVSMLSLDADGCPLPEDWYLTVTGTVAGYLHRSAVLPAQLDAVVRP
jgi:hypothetical protein